MLNKRHCGSQAKSGLGFAAAKMDETYGCLCTFCNASTAPCGLKIFVVRDEYLALGSGSGCDKFIRGILWDATPDTARRMA